MNRPKAPTSRPQPLSATQIAARIRHATGYSELGMPADALRELQPVDESRLLPSRAGKVVLALRGDALRDLGRFEEARAVYSRLLKVSPKMVAAAVGKAWCEKRLGTLDEAIRTLERAVRLNPREAILQYNLACYHALETDKARCLSRLGVAIRLDRSYAAMVREERDFDPIRSDRDFATLVEMAIGD